MDKIKGFFHGVKKESERVHWPKGKELVKYSFVTIILIIFFALYFLAFEWLFTMIRELIK